MNAYSLLRYLSFRNLGLILFYALLCSISYFVAYQLRFDFNVPGNFTSDMVDTLWWILGLKLVLLFTAGQVDCVLSYFRLSDAFQLFLGLFSGSTFLVVLWYAYKGDGMPPRAVILTDLLLSYLLIAGFRISMRVKASNDLRGWLHWDNVENVLIVGAGEVGAGICSELKNKARLSMRPVAFLDDDKRKIGRYIHGVLITGPIDELKTVTKRYAIHRVIIAFSSSVSRMRDVIDMAKEAKLPVSKVPALTDLLSGRAKLTQLNPIEMEDLLGREMVDLNTDQICSMLEGKRVLITGAGGSVGRELVSQILEYAPNDLLCLDRAETSIFDLQYEVLASKDPRGIAKTQILDIYNLEELKTVFKDFKPEIIFHAAAHKHVSLMESEPVEALRNNFFATVGLVRLASAFKVEQCVLISTDKAVKPSSVMGASKRLAELALLEQQKVTGNQTKFMAVRFGNVLGSSGSVIQIFKRQIAEGGPLTVTDPEVARFFMTGQEAVGLVLQSATQGEGGEIFVLNMGESVKIVDIARQMIKLSGYQEGEDIKIKFIGLRPGEKMYEEFQHLSETLQSTSHPGVMRFIAKKESLVSIDSICENLNSHFSTKSVTQIKRTIQKYIPEYTPYLD